MRPYFVILLACLCFGTTGTAQALGANEASSSSIGAARILIGGGLLALIAGTMWLRQGESPLRLAVSVARGTAIRNGNSRGRWERTRTTALVVIGALGVLTYQPTFFLGTRLNGVAIGTIVALGSAPMITGLLDWALRRRFPGVLWLIATLVATAGVTLLSGMTDVGGSTISVLGIVSSVGAGAAYAVYTLASKALLDSGWSPVGTMGGVFGLAAAFSVPLLLAGDASWLASPSGLAMALWLGVVTTTVAYLLFAWGLRRLPAATVSTLTLGEPLTATLLGLLLLGERLPPMAVAGLVVLAAGLTILIAPWRRRRNADAVVLRAAG
ncbi:DMT family transporter [Parafrigoribacterium mesophilum]|uniref:DMT family transporter n=1 Tax=Parafrigoribacterium mesophilum TaxID=433646 RepID=UPI0031FD3EAF